MVYKYHSVHCLISKENIILAPYPEEVINWIFNEDVIDEYLVLNSKMNIKIDWFKYWYNALLNNEFSLMNEFIERLNQFFEKYDLELQIRKCKNGLNKYNANIGKEYKDDIFVGFFATKEQTIHEGIIKCFELIKKQYE